MPKKLRKLIRSARESARWRGHKMCRFQNHDGHCYVSICRNCGCGVRVIENPLPNDIDIGGSAVAINCTHLQTGGD